MWVALSDYQDKSRLLFSIFSKDYNLAYDLCSIKEIESVISYKQAPTSLSLRPVMSPLYQLYAPGARQHLAFL